MQYVPQVVSTKRPLVFWLISAAVAAGGGHPALAEVIYHAFGVFCHQRADRSYFIEGHKLGVCARCTGLYAGFAITLLLYPLIRSLRINVNPPRYYLILAAIPLAVDFSLTFFGFWENTHTSRLLTGTLLGSVAVFYVMPGIVDLSLRSWRATAPLKPSFTLASPESIAAAPSDYSAPERRI